MNHLSFLIRVVINLLNTLYCVHISGSTKSTPPPPSLVRRPYWFRASSLSRLHNHTRFNTLHRAGLLWTDDRPNTETSTWQHTTLTRDRHPCPRQNLHPQTQQMGGRRPTPWNVLPLELATVSIQFEKLVLYCKKILPYLLLCFKCCWSLT
jgi:hypothetical protein